jgi:hypothetical protein
MTIPEQLMAHLGWGDHICHFYETPTDLSEVLLPYFKWGLEHNAACLWVTGSPYGKERGLSELRSVVPDFDRYAEARQIQIFGFEEWYAKCGDLSMPELVSSWVSRKDQAVAAGYSGLRITGNASFLNEATWAEFQKYERLADAAFREQPVISLCSYCGSQCSAEHKIDVMQSHDFALEKSYGLWRPIEVHGQPDAKSHALTASSDVRRTVQECLAGPLEGRKDRRFGILDIARARNHTAYDPPCAIQGCAAARALSVETSSNSKVDSCAKWLSAIACKLDRGRNARGNPRRGCGPRSYSYRHFDKKFH